MAGESIRKDGKAVCDHDTTYEKWSPEDPFLYDLHVRMGEDSVESYFAMRKVEVKNDKEGIPRIFLNNEPYFEKEYWIRDIGRMVYTHRRVMKR